jgi:hypothetical protein
VGAGETIDRVDRGCVGTGAGSIHPITYCHVGVRTGARVRPVRTQFISEFGGVVARDLIYAAWGTHLSAQLMEGLLEL